MVILPELSEAFGEIFNESSATNMSRSFRNQLEHHCRLREDSVYFLDKQTELPHLSQAAGLLFICYKWKTDPLDENVQGMSQELSIITYLPPPYESSSDTSKQYSDYVSHAKNVEFEEDMGQVWDKRDKIATKAFIQGRQRTLYDILSTIANLDADLSFRFSYPETNRPTIVNMLRSIADRISRTDFMRWYHKFSGAAPWITHTLLTYIHGLLSSLAFVSSTSSLQKQVQRDETIPPSAFKTVVQRYEDIVRDIDQAVRNSSLASFSNPPSSYVRPKKRKERDTPRTEDDVRTPRGGGGGGGGGGGSDIERGFLAHRQNTRIVLPRLQERICIDFAQRGFSCNGNHRTCQRGKHLAWYMLSGREKDALKVFASNHAQVDLVLTRVRD